MNDLRIAFENARVETGKMLSLIAGYNRRTLTDEERNRLDDWISSDEFNEQLFVMFTDKTYVPVLREILKSLSPGSNSL